METAIYTTRPIRSSDSSTICAAADRHLLHGNVRLVVASYSAGPTAVALYGGVPPFRETQGYVRKVTELIADARRAAGND